MAKSKKDTFKTKGQLEDELVKLKAFSKAQDVTIDKLTKALDNKEENDENIIELPEDSRLSDEEEIARSQLRKLREKALIGELTLEEIKKYDLLVKNKKISQSDNSHDNGFSLPSGMDDNKLLSMANAKAKKK